MLFRPLVLLAMIAGAAPAKADVQAGFSGGYILEINDDGAMRGNVVSEGYWLMHVDGRDYLVVNDGGVEKVLDAKVVQQVAYDAIPPIFSEIFSQVTPMAFSPTGSVEINGVTGTGYQVDDDPKVAFVISDDPKVQDVGAALSAQFKVWTEMAGPMAVLLEPINGLLAQGAAIRIGDIDLMWVADGEIDDANFALPGAPLGRIETEEVMRRNGMLKT